MRRIFLLLAAAMFLCARQGAAERDYFLGTRTGWKRTNDVFVNGKYNDNRLFLVVGTGPTGRALSWLSHLKSKTTFVEDIRAGGQTFTRQLSESANSVPTNGKGFGESLADIARDPYKELKQPSIVTPAIIIGYTIADIAKVGFYGVMLIAEPICRTVYGTAALVIAPLEKPVEHAGVATAIVATSVYGYASSVTGGAVFLSVTGSVLALDAATSPFVGLYNHFEKEPSVIAPIPVKETPPVKESSVSPATAMKQESSSP